MEIVASRTDGFGQRLKVILAAMRMASHLGCGMKFIWDTKSGTYGQYHACEDVHEIFSDNFIRAHYTAAKPDGTSLTERNFGDLLLNGTSNSDYLLLKRFFDPFDGPTAYSGEFEHVGFTPALDRAIAAARAVTLDVPTYAVHIRGGDLLYGPLRRVALIHADKTIPISVAKSLVRGTSRSWIVFAQDEEIKNHFRSAPNVVVSSDLSADLQTNAQKTIFDMVLMSRCHEIYGGTSAVCDVASILSGNPITKVTDVFSLEQLDHFIASDSEYVNSGYDSYIMSFLNINRLAYTDDPGARKSALQAAISYDPENVGTPILYVYELFACRDYLTAEAVASSLLLKEALNDKGLLLVLRTIDSFMARRSLRQNIPADADGVLEAESTLARKFPCMMLLIAFSWACFRDSYIISKMREALEGGSETRSRVVEKMLSFLNLEETVG